MESSVLAKIGAWLVALLPAVLGSALSAFQDKEKTLAMTKFEAGCTFIFGVIIGYAGGHGLIELFNDPIIRIKPDGFFAFCIQFTFAVIGMSTLNECKAQVPKWFDAARKKLLGE